MRCGAARRGAACGAVRCGAALKVSHRMLSSLRDFCVAAPRPGKRCASRPDLGQDVAQQASTQTQHPRPAAGGAGTSSAVHHSLAYPYYNSVGIAGSDSGHNLQPSSVTPSFTLRLPPQSSPSYYPRPGKCTKSKSSKYLMVSFVLSRNALNWSMMIPVCQPAPAPPCHPMAQGTEGCMLMPSPAPP